MSVIGDDTIEMDTLATHPRRPSRSWSMSRGKPVSPGPATSLDKKDYTIGIGLLLIVVFLWTSSNFLTQVR